MKYWLLPSLLLAVGCQSSDPPAALQETVAAHIPQNSTRRGTQVAHTYQLRTATGQLVRDSTQFLVPRRGPVVRLPRLWSLF